MKNQAVLLPRDSGSKFSRAPCRLAKPILIAKFAPVRPDQSADSEVGPGSFELTIGAYEAFRC